MSFLFSVLAPSTTSPTHTHIRIMIRAKLFLSLLTLVYLTVASVSAAKTDNFRLNNIEGSRHSGSGYKLLLSGYNGTIAPYTFTPPDKLQPSGKILDTVGKGPSWIAFSEDHSIIYSTDDATQALYAIKVGEVKPSVNAAGTKRAANLNSTLTVLDKASSGGDGPLSLAMHGHLLFIANYNNGSASVHELQDNGLFADKKPDRIFHFNREPKGSIGPISSRQDHSYAHQIIIEPSGQWAYVVDLGADKIHRLSVPPSGRGKDVKLVGQTSLATGTGPRHLAFHQEEGKTYAYLAAELETTVTAFQVSPVDGSLKAIGKPLYALPEGVAPGGNSTYGHLRTTSEIAVSPDGKFVYVGTRGDEVEDHISIFKRNADDGSIKFQEWALSGGRNLRHFSLSADQQARYIAAGHQTTQNVTILARDVKTGSLTKTGATAQNIGAVAFAGFVTGPSRRD